MLPDERRRAIRHLLETALDCDAPTREAFIRDSAAGDESLSDEALRVLREISAAATASYSSGGGISDEQLKLAIRNVLAAGDDDLTRNDFWGTKRFEVRRRLGSGGFGTVYEAYDRDQKRLVALKVLRRTDPAFVYRFKREFRALVDIRHPNLIELHELFFEHASWFFTMELVRGVNFLQYVEHQGPLQSRDAPACNVQRLRATSLQLAEGIVALHGAGILHRDIKPANILVSDDGRVRLLDFGLVREAELSRTQSLMVVGTPAYMAPEQAAMLPVDGAADWYSFGVILFQALVGALPASSFRPGTTRSSAASSTLAAFPTGVPDDLRSLCGDLLRRDPSLRPSGREVITRLGGIASGLTLIEDQAAADETLLGREPHLADLKRLLGLTKQGHAVVANVHGPSGIGKSTLLRAFRRRLARHEPDVVVLNGRCHENETVPFKALDDVIDGLSQYLKALPEPEAEALTPRDAQNLLRVFPVLAQVEAITRVRHRAVETPDAQQSRERAFASLLDLLSRLADRRVVVLIIDDLQWGDLDSTAFISKLLTDGSPPSLLFIACYRTEDADTSPFLQKWRSTLASAEFVQVHDLAVAELTVGESKALASRLLSGTASGSDTGAASIAQESGGSPFLIDQFAQYIRRSADIDASAIGIHQVIERRVAGLPEHARTLLETLAVAGQLVPCETANVASGLDVNDRAGLSMLVTERLARVRETQAPLEVEVYHDQIRDAITASLSPEIRGARHLTLAQVLEARGGIDPAVLATHFQEGGDHASATRHTLRAAEHAEAALAFERAAHFYETALNRGTWSQPESVHLRRKLAGALVNAGHGTRAARVYLDASRLTRPTESAALKRCAADQLLRSGHLTDGIELLRAIARDLGIWVPSTPWQALLSFLAHRVRLALRGLRTTKQPSLVRPKDATVLDVYWSLAIGLAWLDVVQAMDFQSRHLLLALRVADRDRLAMSMASEAANRAASRRRNPYKILDLQRRARELCVSTSHPESLGLISVMAGVSALLTGDWRAAWQLSREADDVLREKCVGVAWERGSNTQVGMAAALHLGEWSKLSSYSERLPRLVHEAKARGDIHTMHSLLGAAYMTCLASDTPMVAEELVSEAMSTLPANCFVLNHFYVAMEAAIDTMLYKGDAERAWSLATSSWPALSTSQLLRVQLVAIMAFHLRARAAIAVACASPENARAYLGDALRCAQRIEHEKAPWGDMLALTVRAGVASFDTRRDATLQLLAQAEARAEAAQMSHYVAACRHRRGALIGGTEGSALVSAAEAWCASEGVVRPARIFDTIVPGRF